MSPGLTSSGFSLVMRAAMTWPLGTGALVGLLKQMGVSPHGLSPYSTRMSFILCKGMPMAICTSKKEGFSCWNEAEHTGIWRSFPLQASNLVLFPTLQNFFILYSLQSDPRAFRYLELGSGEVHIRNHFRAGVLDLQAWVQLEEVEAPVLAVEVLDGARAHVAHHLRQADRTLQERVKPQR